MGGHSATPVTTTTSVAANSGTVPNNIPLQSELTGQSQNILDANAPFSYYTPNQLLPKSPFGEVYTQGPNQSIIGDVYGQSAANSATNQYYGTPSAAPYTGTATYGNSGASQSSSGGVLPSAQQGAISGGGTGAGQGGGGMGPFDSLLQQLLGMGIGSGQSQWGGNASALNSTGLAYGQQPNYGLFGGPVSGSQQNVPKSTPVPASPAAPGAVAPAQSQGQGGRR